MPGAPGAADADVSPSCKQAEDPFIAPERGTFYRAKSYVSELRRLALESLPAVGFKPRIVKEANGAASALAFVAAGFGVAVVSEPLQKIPPRT
jgi:DNA-binding transcriptional LysR family regulator